MSGLYSRVKGAIRNVYSRKAYYNPEDESYNEGEMGYPEEWEEEQEVEIKDENQSVKNDNQSQKSSNRNQKSPTEVLPPPPITSPEVVTPVQPISPVQPTTNLPVPPPVQEPTPQSALLPPIIPVAQPPVRNTIPSVKKRNRRPFLVNPNSTLVGFPHSVNIQSLWSSKPPFLPLQNRLPPPPPQQKKIYSNLEIDYPIENILIDENIPSSMAIKINEAIEHDRFGNTYHTQHYAHRSKIQHIIHDNNRQFIENSSYPTGLRYIREISYPQKEIYYNLPFIYNNRSELNSFPTPINHYIALATPDDPMKYY